MSSDAGSHSPISSEQRCRASPLRRRNSPTSGPKQRKSHPPSGRRRAKRLAGAPLTLIFSIARRPKVTRRSRRNPSDAFAMRREASEPRRRCVGVVWSVIQFAYREVAHGVLVTFVHVAAHVVQLAGRGRSNEFGGGVHGRLSIGSCTFAPTTGVTLSLVPALGRHRIVPVRRPLRHQSRLQSLR